MTTDRYHVYEEHQLPYDAERAIYTMADEMVYASAFDKLTLEVQRLRGIVDEVHGWAVCCAIADATYMAQNLPHICEITAPKEV